MAEFKLDAPKYDWAQQDSRCCPTCGLDPQRNVSEAQQPIAPDKAAKSASAKLQHDFSIVSKQYEDLSGLVTVFVQMIDAAIEKSTASRPFRDLVQVWRDKFYEKVKKE